MAERWLNQSPSPTTPNLFNDDSRLSAAHSPHLGIVPIFVTKIKDVDLFIFFGKRAAIGLVHTH